MVYRHRSLDFGAGTVVQFARFSHDGARLIVEILSLDRDEDVGRIEVWDWRRGERVTTIDTETWRAVPSPVGHLVAVGSPDRASRQRVTVWSADTGEQIATLAGHTGGINDLAFSADGSRLAAGSVDGTTRIWDATTGDLLLTLGGHIGHLTSVSFSPDGTQLVTAGVDGTIRVWALDLDELVELTEKRVTRGFTDDECRRYLHDDDCGED